MQSWLSLGHRRCPASGWWAHLIITLWQKLRSPAALKRGWGAAVSCGIRLAWSGYCLSVFRLTGLASGGTGFPWSYFFLLALAGPSRWPASLFQVWDTESKQNQTIKELAAVWLLRCFDHYLSFSESSILYLMPGVSPCTQCEQKGKACLISLPGSLQ